MKGDCDVLETERLIVRPYTLDDIDVVRRVLYCGPPVWGPHTREQVADSVTMAMLQSQSADDGAWAKRAVTLKETGELVGQVRLGPSRNYFYRWEEEPEPRYNAVEVELAFVFGQEFWGKSYAFEASQAMIRFTFEKLRLPRLVNGTGDDNIRSINLHRRLGFKIFRSLPNNDGVVAVLNNNLV